MSAETLTLEQGLETWRHDAAVIGQQRALPDSQNGIIGLLGVYIATAQQPEDLTVYAWRRTILSSGPTVSALRSILPSIEQDQLDDDYPVKVDEVKEELRMSTPLQIQHFARATLDGLPEGIDEIPGSEYYLSKLAGYTVHNYALLLQPLRLTRYAYVPLQDFFPSCLEFVQENNQ